MIFRIDLKIFILLVLFYFTEQIEIYATIMIFAIIHEFGHLLAGLLLGMKPKNIQINPFGVSINFKTIPNDYNHKIKKANLLEIKKIFVASAGPLTNVILIIALLLVPLPEAKKLISIYSNLLLIVINILPIYPLDGGRILKGILHIYFGKHKSSKYINNISFIIVSVLTVIASITILYFKNMAIFLGIMYLWILVLKEDKKFKVEEKIYRQLQLVEEKASYN